MCTILFLQGGISMKILINLLLEGIALLVLLNVLTMLIPKPIKIGLNGTIRLLSIIFSILFKATINTVNLVNKQVNTSINSNKNVRRKPSKKSNNVINFQDKKLRKES